MNYEELKDWCADARRSVEREKDRLQGTQKGSAVHPKNTEGSPLCTLL